MLRASCVLPDSDPIAYRQPTTTIMFQALDLANRGLPVFPCDERKRPITRHGFKDASRADQAIGAMFGKSRAKLIGVPTGTVTGTVVVDIDVKDGRAGAEWLAEHEARLPITRTHRTPSGGRHLVYRYPAGALDIRSTAGVIAPGVDIRANGGYACWPSCGGYVVADGARRADLPEWLIPLLLRPPPAPKRPDAGPPVQTDQFGRYGAFIASLLDQVRQAPEGGKHYTLLRIGRTIGGALAAAGMSKADAVTLLIDALPDTVLDWEAAKATAEWALTKGQADPIQLEDRPWGSR